MWPALALSVLVIVYNTVLNRWRPFHGPAYVPLNLVFVGALSLVAFFGLDLSRAQLGLRGDVGDALVALALVAVFALGAFGIALSGQSRRIADRRVEHMHGRGLAYYVLVRIPLGTAMTEEILFRGILFAAWRHA